MAFLGEIDHGRNPNGTIKLWNNIEINQQAMTPKSTKSWLQHGTFSASRVVTCHLTWLTLADIDPPPNSLPRSHPLSPPYRWQKLQTWGNIYMRFTELDLHYSHIQFGPARFPSSVQPLLVTSAAILHTCMSFCFLHPWVLGSDRVSSSQCFQRPSDLVQVSDRLAKDLPPTGVDRCPGVGGDRCRCTSRGWSYVSKVAW